ncbi:MAG: GHKL domain-containing protein [Oscillospiraceae bacterium]|nr:GHKL domain-containing protein [Oscillospiraceae bacterium]
MWYVNYFHIQILIIELLFCWRLQKRKFFWLRLIPAAVVFCLLPLVTPVTFFAPFFQIGWFTLGFLFYLVLSAGVLLLCFRMTAKQLIFYCCVAHTVQHMVHCLGWMISQGLHLTGAWDQAVQLAAMIVITALAWLLLRRRFRGSETADIKSTVLVVFAAISTLVVYFISYWTTMRETSTVGVQFFDFTTCALLLMILLDLFRFREAEREQLIMLRLLRQEQEQHRMSRAAVEVINRKCHDLKHQISALRHMSSEEQERSIGQLEKAVMIYDSFPKSGNDDLDIILAEESLQAEKLGVRLHCIADGARLSFMGTEDLYSLMGNALDNAIEGAAGEESPAKRIVTLNISAQGSLLSVHVENPCARAPIFADGLPVTTKSDKDYHGYGVRSMRYIAEKYGGAMTSGWEDGVFLLDIVFPLK